MELRREAYLTGIIAVDNGRTGISKDMKYAGLREVTVVDDELSLFNALERVVHDLDPDALTSFELQHGGWGYVGARYKHHFGMLLSYYLKACRLYAHTMQQGATHLMVHLSRVFWKVMKAHMAGQGGE